MPCAKFKLRCKTCSFFETTSTGMLVAPHEVQHRWSFCSVPLHEPLRTTTPKRTRARARTPNSKLSRQRPVTRRELSLRSAWSSMVEQATQTCFSRVFGFREKSYTETRAMLDMNYETGIMTSKANKRAWKVGQFTTPSLGQLRHEAEQKGGTTNMLPGRLKMRVVTGDVSRLHGLPNESQHSTFQVASQFNCLEFINPNMTPERGVTCYENDRTQGPACSVACLPATVYRNYFVPVPLDEQLDQAETDAVVQLGQSRERQLNTLSDLSRALGNVPHGRCFTVDGGYTFASDASLQQMNREVLDGLDEEKEDALRALLRVGLHPDVDVTATHGGERLIPPEQQQRVTQVFGSACSVSYSGYHPELWMPLSRIVLQANYEAALHVAVANAHRHADVESARTVYLTCIGGGAYGNDVSWIARAMQSALERFKHTGLDVVLVQYSSQVPDPLQRLLLQYS